LKKKLVALILALSLAFVPTLTVYANGHVIVFDDQGPVLMALFLLLAAQ